MTFRTPFRAIALMATAILVAACGGTASTTAPGGATQAPATVAPATVAPATSAPGSEAPGASGAFPSFALPSGFNADTQLEGLLPDELGGQAVFKFSMTGDQFMGSGQEGSEELSGALGELGKTPADLSVAIGGSQEIGVFAYRIKGVDANTFYSAFLQMAGTAEGATITDATIAGKAVKKVVTATGETVYIYASGDVLFGVGGDAVSDDLLNEAFTKLP